MLTSLPCSVTSRAVSSSAATARSPPGRSGPSPATAAKRSGGTPTPKVASATSTWRAGPDRPPASTVATSATVSSGSGRWLGHHSVLRRNAAYSRSRWTWPAARSQACSACACCAPAVSWPSSWVTRVSADRRSSGSIWRAAPAWPIVRCCEVSRKTQPGKVASSRVTWPAGSSQSQITTSAAIPRAAALSCSSAGLATLTWKNTPASCSQTVVRSFSWLSRGCSSTPRTASRLSSRITARAMAFFPMPAGP